MAGNVSGAEATAARRVGVSVEEYRRRIDAGERWCWACKAFHQLDAFGFDRTRFDGYARNCLASRRVKR